MRALGSDSPQLSHLPTMVRSTLRPQPLGVEPGGGRQRLRSLGRPSLRSHLFHETSLALEELAVAVFCGWGSRLGGRMRQDDENCVLGWLGFRSSPNWSQLSRNMTQGSRGLPRVAWYLLLLMALPSRPQVPLTRERKITCCLRSRVQGSRERLRRPEECGGLVGLESDHSAGRPARDRRPHRRPAGRSGGLPSALRTGSWRQRAPEGQGCRNAGPATPHALSLSKMDRLI